MSLRREGAVKKAALPSEMQDECCAHSCPYSGNGDRNRHLPYRGPSASPVVCFSGSGSDVHLSVPAVGTVGAGVTRQHEKARTRGEAGHGGHLLPK